jgi:hypothetical protein
MKGDLSQYVCISYIRKHGTFQISIGLLEAQKKNVGRLLFTGKLIIRVYKNKKSSFMNFPNCAVVQRGSILV